MSADRVTTARERILSICDRWQARYRHPDGTWQSGLGDWAEVYERLRALDLRTCSVEEVEAIVGGTKWTRWLCDGCGALATAVVQVGEAPDYESSTASICLACVEAARAALLERLAKDGLL